MPTPEPTAPAPRVSVIMRTKNADDVVGQALAGLFSQRFRDFELIVVDSGSTDRTLDIVRPNFPIQFKLENVALEGWKTVAVGVTQTNGRSIWNCPNRPSFPRYNPNYEYVIGYQYYGGITTWKNNLGNFPSASPVKTATSKPGWMLAADHVAQAGGTTSGNWAPFAGLPAHKDFGHLPAGANEVFIDGSARWINARDMMFLHSWNQATAALYIYQEDLGAQLEPKRAQLSTVK